MATSLRLVTIDGPAGAGKSTVARILAARLGFAFMDTGAMYRAVTLTGQRHDVAPENGTAMDALLAELPVIDFTSTGGIRLGDEDISDAIRSAEVTARVSPYAAVPAVRDEMGRRQRALGEGGGYVCEGRDMGTDVFPDAAVRIYLDASPQVRARRRHDELVTAGREVDFDQLLEEIVARDKYDSEREVAPLRRLPEQTHVDTSDMSQDEVVDELERLARAGLRATCS